MADPAARRRWLAGLGLLPFSVLLDRELRVLVTRTGAIDAAQLRHIVAQLGAIPG